MDSGVLQRCEIGIAEWCVFASILFNVPSFALKSPCVVCGPLSSLRLFICSLPHLEDLTVSRVRIAKEDDNTTFQPLTSPPLTGTLTISRPRRVERLVTWLLELPNEIHFRKFRFLWDRAQEVQWVMNFVHACSSTLEHADFEHQVDGELYHLSVSM